jgi:uncharacterized protein (TIGR00369 family)
MSPPTSYPPPGWTRYQPHSPFTAQFSELWEFWDAGTQTLKRGFIATRQQMNATGIAHGGMLMTFADSVMARNVWCVTGRYSVTLQMNVNFLAPAREGQWIEGISQVTRATETTAFLALSVAAGGHPCLSATGIFRLRRRRTEANPA